MTGISQVDIIKNSAQKPFSSNEIVAEDVSNHQIADYTEYQICLDDVILDSIKKDNDLMISCPDRICAECGNDHSFRGNFDDAITSIDMLPALFKDDIRGNCSVASKLEEFVN